MKQWKLFCALMVVVMLLATLSACAAAPASKKLVIASDASFPPMEFVDDGQKDRRLRH